MMKFFRKYMKHFMVVGCALLMIVFVGGQALSNLLRPDQSMGQRVEGTAFGGETIRNDDMQLAYAEADTLDFLFAGWRGPWFHVLRNLDDSGAAFQAGLRRINLGPLDTKDWYMLDAAARRSGIYLPPETIEKFKQNAGITSQRIATLRDRRRTSTDHIEASIKSYLSVLEMATLACGAVHASEADIQDFIRKATQQIRVSAVAIDSKKFIDEFYEPTEVELGVQFDEYKNVASRPAGPQLDFGYQLPEEVQIEYIRISTASLTDRQTIDAEEALDYWEQHTDEFLRPTVVPKSQPATSSAPAAPPPPPAPKPYATFTEAKHLVIEKLKKEAAKKEALRLARDLIGRFNRPWADIPEPALGEYKDPPEAAKSDQVYPQIVDKIQDRYGGAVSYGRTQFLDSQGFSGEPELGRANALPRTAQEIPLRRAAFFVEGLSARPEGSPDHEHLFRSLYQTCAEPFVVTSAGDTDGDTYVVRSVGLRPERPPTSIDPLRERLIEDVRKKLAFEEAERLARLLADEAQAGNLRDALANDAVLQDKLGDDVLIEPPPFTQQRLSSPPGSQGGGMPMLGPNYVFQLGYDPSGPSIVDACFGLVGHRSTTQPAPVLVWEQPRQTRWLVVQLEEVIPITEGEYDERRPAAAQFVRLERQIDLLADWFAPGQIQARIQWRDATPTVGTSDADDEETDETPPDRAG